MTHADWIALLSQAVALLLPMLVALIGAWITGIGGRLSDFLRARHQAEMAATVTSMSASLQSAMSNAAGRIALRIQQGELNLDKPRIIAMECAKEAADIARRMPSAIAIVQPADGAISAGVQGKLTQALLPPPSPVPEPAPAPAPTSTDLPTTSYTARAGLVVSWLMRDLAPLERFQAAAIAGNGGQESGLRAVNEVHPVVSPGGFGWFQWTGPRRRAFEAWCLQNNLSVTDDAANYQFLLYELRGPEKAALDALRQTKTLEEAVNSFEEHYERAGVKAIARRTALAQQALAS